MPNFSDIRLTIPVSKPLPRKQLSGIIKDFKDKNMTFGLINTVKGKDVWEIWREALGYRERQELSLKKFPRVKKFDLIWDHGIQIDQLSSWASQTGRGIRDKENRKW